jgi:tetratricopeptide (TPR) repeat protein
MSLFHSCASKDVNSEATVEEKKASVYYDQGTSELISKNYKQALTNLLKAKELKPNDSNIRNNLGMAYYFREQIQFALEELKEAVSLDNKNSDAKMNLATIYLEKNNLKEAKKLYDQVLTDLTYVALYRVHYNLALLNLKIGDRKGAFEELAKSVKDKEDYCQAHYKMGELYTEEYKYNEALAAFTESTMGTCVSNPETHFAVAEALINLNKYEEARSKLESIIEKFPKSNFKILAQKKLANLSREAKDEHTARRIEELKNNETIETPKF